jgi:CheY-like chemotaxis protein
MEMIESVLVATSDPFVGELLRSLLEGAGYAVSFPVDGQDVLRMVLLTWPSLIVLDLISPRIQGREFLDIRSRYPLLPMIPVLAISDGPPGPGVEGVLTRPLVPRQVLAEVRRMTGAAARSAGGTCRIRQPTRGQERGDVGLAWTYLGGSSRPR